MSYNGIGLSTPRGTATSGHIQNNSASLWQDKKGRYESRRRLDEVKERDYKKFAKHQEKKKTSNDYMVKRESLRTIELKCLELRTELEDDEVEEDEIDRKVEELRALLTKKLEEENAFQLRKRKREEEAREQRRQKERNIDSAVKHERRREEPSTEKRKVAKVENESTEETRPIDQNLGNSAVIKIEDMEDASKIERESSQELGPGNQNDLDKPKAESDKESEMPDALPTSTNNEKPPDSTFIKTEDVGSHRTRRQYYKKKT